MMSSTKSSESPIDENLLSIRQEIQRFESVHPNIYAVYDLIEAIIDPTKDRHEIAESLKHHVVLIEDAFVNSQEWTLSSNVPDIKLGLLGSIYSGKSALIHRYLTESYVPDESPEGGRFKKDVLIENQSFLLLIRDEGGPPDEQFSNWIDGLIFVFSLDSEESYQEIFSFYNILSEFRENMDIPIILVGTTDSLEETHNRVIDDMKIKYLVSELHESPYYESSAKYGHNVEKVFQDASLRIVRNRSGSVVRPINLSSYNEQLMRQQQMYNHSMMVNTCQQAPIPPRRDGSMAPVTELSVNPVPPNFNAMRNSNASINANIGQLVGSVASISLSSDKSFASSKNKQPVLRRNQHQGYDHDPTERKAMVLNMWSIQKQDLSQQQAFYMMNYGSLNSLLVLRNFTNSEMSLPVVANENNMDGNNEPSTPGSTPTQSRKNRRKSNLFKKNEDERDRAKLNGIGSGRTIPIKQGHLMKRTTKALNKEWRTKKYVTLTEDGRLTYHTSIHDYMENNQGKEIDLSRTTVKIPGIAFRQAGTTVNGGNSNPLLSRSQIQTNAAFDPIRKFSNGIHTNGANASSNENQTRRSANKDSSSKKRHKRMKSNPKTNSDSQDGSESGFEFQLISVDRTWNFEAPSLSERDDWVHRIEEATLARLQSTELKSSRQSDWATTTSSGAQSNQGSTAVISSNSRSSVSNNGLLLRTTPEDASNNMYSIRDSAGSILNDGSQSLDDKSRCVSIIKSVMGNQICADCGTPNPEWASLNLGTLICIGCSGIHRQLGTHISRVRSLTLDNCWTTELVSVMRAIGNTLANAVWEAAAAINAGSRKKPDQSSSHEEKEQWIRAKYERREFLPPLPYPDCPLQQQLIDAIAREDTRQVILCLAKATPETVNAPYSRQDPRAAIHIAATLGNIVYLQLLLWYNGDPSVVDHEGRNAFFYAHCSNKFDCAEFLLRNGCPQQQVPMPIPGGNVMLPSTAGPMVSPTGHSSGQPVVISSAVNQPLTTPTPYFAPPCPQNAQPIFYAPPANQMMPSHIGFSQQQTGSAVTTLPRRRGPQPLPAVQPIPGSIYRFQGPQGVVSPIASPMLQPSVQSNPVAPQMLVPQVLGPLPPMIVPPASQQNPNVPMQHSQSSDSSSASPSLHSNSGSAGGGYGKPMMPIGNASGMYSAQIKNTMLHNNEIGL